MSKTVPLSKPLQTHNGEVSSLTFRDVDAQDIVTMRTPPVRFVEVNGENHAEFRYDIIMQLASRLCGVDDILLGKLKAKDFHVVSQAVLAQWNASGE